MAFHFPLMALLLLLLVALQFSNIQAALYDEPVQIENGLVQGVAGAQFGDSGVTVFRSIPFAAPPVGELRWRPPQPAANWEGVYNASEFTTFCQNEFLDASTSGFAEDCLNLNVFTAANNSNEKRPVYVWYFGGGGKNQDTLYDGEGLAKQGLVVVVPNYRSLVLDRLAHPLLSAESGLNISGNYGLLDQIHALLWVQRNIAAFGGDPRKVTIGGESAGSAAVEQILFSPLAKGLFLILLVNSGIGLGGYRL